MKEKMIFIVARDRPKILKPTSLQLTLLCFSCSKSCSFDNVFSKSGAVHVYDSLKKPCSIPK